MDAVFVCIAPHPVHAFFVRKLKPKTIKLEYKKYRPILPLYLFVKSLRMPKADLYIAEDTFYCFITVFFKTFFDKNIKIVTINADQNLYYIKNLDAISFARKLFLLFYMNPFIKFGKPNGVVSVSRLSENQLPSNWSEVKKTIIRPSIVDFERGSTKNKKFDSTFVFIGNKSKVKGFILLVDVFRFLPEFKLKIIGEASIVLKDKDLPSNVELIGYLDRKELKKELEKAVFYIHLAAFEPFGMVVVEAMSLGVIPIISSTTGASEIISSKELVLNLKSPQETAVDVRKIFYKVKNNYDYYKKKTIEDFENYNKQKSDVLFYDFVKKL